MRFVSGALRRFWWLPLAGAAAAALGALVYEARFRAVRHTASASLAGRRASELLQDRDVVQLAAALTAAHHDERETLGPDYWKGASEEALREKLDKAGLVADAARWPEVRNVEEPRVAVKAEGETATAESGDADQARLAANARAKAAVLVGAARQRHAAARVESLRTLVELGETDGVKIEEAAREMERTMAALQGSADAIVRDVEAVRTRQDQARARIRALEAAEHRLRESLPSGPEEDGLTSTLFEKLRAEREAVRAERALKMAGRVAEDPEVRRLTQRMTDLELEMRKELYVVREKSIVGLRNAIDAMESERRSLDERGLRKLLEIRELAETIREKGPRRAEQERLVADLTAAEKLRRDLGDESVPLATLAVEATQTSRAGGIRWGLVGWGLLAGAGGGLLASLLLRVADRRVRSGDDVKRRLGVGVLGLAEEVKGDPLVLRAAAGRGPSADYSLAAGVLRGYMAEREFRTVLVTSAAAGEGKSTAAANLATALARKGMNVALVDADLRAPRQASFFGLDDSQGLSTVLLGAEPQGDLPAGATDVATLRVLTAGPIADLPEELLESPRMADLLRLLRERYDVVVIDGPPVTAGGDAVTLARLADTVAWVVRAGRLPAARLGWVKHILKNVGADVAGVLLIGAGESAAEREYAYPAGVTK
jgi:capsular exopolysaccharide synthesis family protein